MHLKVFVKLKKTLKTLSSGQKTQKNPKNPNKPKKTQENPLGWVFFKKPGFLPTLSLGLHKGLPSYSRSLQLSKENIQHFKR